MIKIGPGWTLFVDRDGVLNQRIENDYVKHPDEFLFISGVKEALKDLSGKFERIIIVTNQQGIGRGLMNETQLQQVHQKLKEEIKASGGRIDAVFFSPDLKNSRSFTRKPSVGMGLMARKMFPSIRFKNSIMVGDTFTDILFGYRLGMKTVLIGKDEEIVRQCSEILDYRFDNLFSFAQAVQIVEL